MTGAAGGLSGGLWAVHGATLEPGAPWILDALDFDERMRAARAVVTGEGKLDEQTLQGKLVGEIGTRTRQAGVPLHAIVGTDALDALRQAHDRPPGRHGGDDARGDRGAPARTLGRRLGDRATPDARALQPRGRARSSRSPRTRRAGWGTARSAPSTCCSG